MKLVSMLAMSAGLVLAPVAQAQISCQHVGHLNEAATDEFDGVVGDETDTDDIYASTYSLGDGSGCQITYDVLTTYACSWVFDSAAAATANYGAQSRALAECVGAWERSAIDAGSPAEGLNTLEGVSFFSTDDDEAELTWFAYVEERTDADMHDWHVWVGLDYF